MSIITLIFWYNISLISISIANVWVIIIKTFIYFKEPHIWTLKIHFVEYSARYWDNHQCILALKSTCRCSRARMINEIIFSDIWLYFWIFFPRWYHLPYWVNEIFNEQFSNFRRLIKIYKYQEKKNWVSRPLDFNRTLNGCDWQNQTCSHTNAAHLSKGELWELFITINSD